MGKEGLHRERSTDRQWPPLGHCIVFCEVLNNIVHISALSWIGVLVACLCKTASLC